MENKRLEYIPVEKIHPHPDNPRKDLGDLSELAESIKANGVLQNLTVSPMIDLEDPDAFIGHEQYTVVIGHRRLAAAKLAGLKEVPCIVAYMDHNTELQTMLLENIQRADLTVYEQAQGFQMMMDLGETVDSISEKSGFSRTTIRRRLKMAELDKDLLQEVSSRPLQMQDFDELAKIDDIKTRNKILKEIGTQNFKWSVEQAISKQEYIKKLPAVKAALQKTKLKALKEKETYGGKYELAAKSIYVPDWNEGDELFPASKKPTHYHINEYNHRVDFYKEHERAKAQRRSAEEIEHEKQVKAAWDAVDQFNQQAHKMRADFIKGLEYTRRNERLILFGAIASATVSAYTYDGVDRETVRKIAGVESIGYKDAESSAALMKKLHDGFNNKEIKSLVYAMFNDGKNRSFACGYRGRFPEHSVNTALCALYDWLCSLGYEMSDEEKAMRDGTHELFSAGQKENGEGVQ